jgi:LAO/AO transport system kinase
MKGINPTFKRSDGSFTPQGVSDWLDAIQNGGISGVSRAISLLENKKPEARKMAMKVLERCMPYTGKSIRIAISGIPGAGKSTFIEAIGNEILQKNYRIAVLAIDPSSQRTGGSILGDKTRMESLAKHPNVYIRPSPAGQSLGGVAANTREAMYICEAAGYDLILIETVGVGQSEVAVHSMADLMVLLTIPGAGDELQGIKRGIMEMADCIVVNKAETPNETKAQQAARELRNATHVFPPHPYGMELKIMLASATTNQGIPEFIDHCFELINTAKNSGMFEERRKDQSEYWLNEALHQIMVQSLMENKQNTSLWEDLKMKVKRGETNPFSAADSFWKQFLSSKKTK